VKKLYDLVIRIPVFQLDDGRICGEAQTTLPWPTPGAPNAVESTPRRSLADAVDAVVEFATANSVLILGDDATTTPHLEQMRRDAREARAARAGERRRVARRSPGSRDPSSRSGIFRAARQTA